jgi:hypothetical protein
MTSANTVFDYYQDIGSCSRGVIGERRITIRSNCTGETYTCLKA